MGIDIDPNSDADLIHDVTKTLPGLEDSDVDVSYCSHVIEHIPEPMFFNCIAEMIRVLKPGGEYILKFPFHTSESSIIPGHFHYFSPQFINAKIHS